jgi:protocatechuate 3,4-dioxygenase beta subunit
MSRRGALAAFGGVSLAAVLVACGGSSSTSSTSTSVATTNPDGTLVMAAEEEPATTTASAPVELATEMTEGPYYLDLDLVRSDVREDRDGVALALGLRVVDADGQPVPDAAVDIWHCDGEGLYSGFVAASAQANGSSSADDGTFLRGTQLTDAAGDVAFTTIYPGWYQGRTVHIHVKVHVDGNEVHTGQLFFDDAFTDAVYASAAPYSARSARTTRNDADGIYRDGGAASVLDVQPSNGAYAATLTMAVAA